MRRRKTRVLKKETSGRKKEKDRQAIAKGKERHEQYNLPVLL